MLSIEDSHLLSLLYEQLTAAGFAPKEVRYDDIFAMQPTFGPKEEAVFVVDAGSDTERVHTLAKHLYHGWSEQGLVLYIVYYSEAVRDEDIFRLWALDAGWAFNQRQQFYTTQWSTSEAEASSQDLVRCLRMHLHEAAEIGTDGSA